MGLAMPNSALNQSARQKNVANMIDDLKKLCMATTK